MITTLGAHCRYTESHAGQDNVPPESRHTTGSTGMLGHAMSSRVALPSAPSYQRYEPVPASREDDLATSRPRLWTVFTHRPLNHNRHQEDQHARSAPPIPPSCGWKLNQPMHVTGLNIYTPGPATSTSVHCSPMGTAAKYPSAAGLRPLVLG